MLALRETFVVQSRGRLLKRPVVAFNYPKSARDCLSCRKAAYLLVYVGLCNVFVIQFVVVVLAFFAHADEELDFLATIGSLFSH